MRWQCQFHNSKGVRCIAPAVYRFLFHNEHPFDYTDRCIAHAPGWWKGKQVLEQEEQYGGNRIGREVSDTR